MIKKSFFNTRQSLCSWGDFTFHNCVVSCSNLLPIDVVDKSLDVFSPAASLVVNHVSMFPNIHNQDRCPASDVAILVFGDKMVRKFFCLSVCVQNCPADASSFSRTFKIFFPGFKETTLLFVFIFFFYPILRMTVQGHPKVFHQLIYQFVGVAP